MSNESNTYKVIPAKNKKLKLRSRKRIPYSEILMLLLQGEEVFMEVDRRMAYYIAKNLNSIAQYLGIDTRIEKYPTTIEEDGETLEGYVFKMVSFRSEGVDLLDRSAIIEEIRKLLERAEAELEILEKQPPDKSLTIMKKMIKARIETLKEVLQIIEKF